jgi:hypothetical protein
VSYDVYPYLYGFVGGIFKNPAAGDYSVTLNNEAGRTALDFTSGSPRKPVIRRLLPSSRPKSFRAC